MTQASESHITMNEWLSRFKQSSCHQIFEDMDQTEQIPEIKVKKQIKTNKNKPNKK